MRHTAPGQGPEGFRDSPVRDQLAYIHAEQMLDRTASHMCISIQRFSSA